MSSSETGPDSAGGGLAGSTPSHQQLSGQPLASRSREGEAMDDQGPAKRIKSEPVATSVQQQQLSTASSTAMPWPPVTMNTAMFLQSIPVAYHNPMTAAGSTMGSTSGVQQQLVSSAGSMGMQAHPQMMSLQQQAMIPNQQYASLQGQPMQTMNALNMQRQQQLYGMSMPAAAAQLLMHQQQLEQQTLATQPRVDHPCVFCKNKDNVFTCAGACGLHAHVKCIGEDLLFPFKDGSLCGNCFVMQQNRASKEDLRKGGMNGLSVRRAILCLNLETNSHSNFDKFGHLASLRLHEIGEIAGYPIKPFAEKFVEPYLQRWVREKLSTSAKNTINVREIFTFMIGLYSLQKACIAHGLKEQMIEIVKARNLSVTDFLGWHPSIESPQVRCSSLCAICGIRNSPELDQCSRCHRKLVFPTIFTKYASGLLATFYAEKVGIPLGTSCLDVFAHTNTLRASYKGLKPIDPDGVDWETFADQLRMIFGLLDVVSNFGVLQLNPRLFEPEVKIIFNPVYVNHAMLATEYEVVGKFLQCMRFFGQNKTVEHINLIVMCERFLLLKQHPNGSWCKVNGTTVDQYKATVTCAKALVIPVFRGMGPISPEFQRLLEKWSRGSNNSKPQEPHDAKLLACGASVKASTRASLKNLETFYKRQATPKNGTNALEKLITARLRSILPSKAAIVASSGTKIKNEDGDNIKPENADDIKPENGDDIKQEKTDIAEEGESPPFKNEVKQESESTSSLNAQSTRSREEDEALTNLSLNEELAIFDGLKFEGGDVIFVNHQAQEATDQANAPTPQDAEEDAGEDDGDNEGTADENDGEDETDVDGDAEGVDTVREDNEAEEDVEQDDMTDEVYDDDDDENDGHQTNDGDDEADVVAANETENVDVEVNDLDLTEHSELIDPSMDLSLDT